MTQSRRWTLTAALIFCTVQTAAAQKDRPDADPFRSCASCHGVPDSRLAPDALWIKRIDTTACVQPAAPGGKMKRRTLIDFLRGSKVSRPTVVDKKRPARKNEGKITVAFDRGQVLFVPADGAPGGPVRLVWKGDKSDDNSRPLPAGRWRLRNYKILRRDTQGVEWQIWGSGGKGRVVVVEKGKTLRLGLDQTITTKARAGSRRNKFQVGVSVTGDGRMGVTVVKAGKRVAARYFFIAGDAIVSRGEMRYG